MATAAPEPSTAGGSAATALPKVVQFAYKNYHTDGKQRNAQCKICNSKIKDKEGTTSNFIRHLKTAHEDSETKHTKITLELSVCARVHVCVGDLLSVDRVLNINKTTISLTSVTNVDL